MKTLNATSTKTMNKMVSMLKDGYVKIDNANGDFMAVSVEELFSNEKIKVISIVDMPTKLTTSRRFKLTILCRRILTTSSVFLQERSFPCFD